MVLEVLSLIESSNHNSLFEGSTTTTGTDYKLFHDCGFYERIVKANDSPNNHVQLKIENDYISQS